MYNYLSALSTMFWLYLHRSIKFKWHFNRPIIHISNYANSALSILPVAYFFNLQRPEPKLGTKGKDKQQNNSKLEDGCVPCKLCSESLNLDLFLLNYVAVILSVSKKFMFQGKRLMGDVYYQLLNIYFCQYMCL